MFPRCVECASESGSAERLNLLLRLGACWTKDTLVAAARGGSLEVVRVLMGLGCPCNSLALTEAAKHGHIDVLRFLREKCKRCPWDLATCYAVANGGNLECLRYCVENGAPFDRTWTEIGAGKSGRPEVLEYLTNNESVELPGCLRRGLQWSESACRGIAAGGNLALLKRFHEEFRVPWDFNTCNAAAQNGHFECLRYAHENGCPWSTESMCAYAVGGGSVECLRYCFEHGCSTTDPRICAEASGWSLELLRFAHEIVGCPWDVRSPYTAARDNRLDVLRHLHENGCPWDTRTSQVGARHLRILRYCHENGCTLDKDVCLFASQNRSSSSCLAFARQNGCSGTRDGMQMAIAWGSVVCLRYFRQLGRDWAKDVRLCATTNNRVEILKYAHERGVPVDGQMMESAVKYDSPECFCFGISVGCTWDVELLSGQPNFKKWVEQGVVPPIQAT